jgi:thioesterase domain-containing protein
MPRIDALPDDSKLLKQMLVDERAEHESAIERIKNEAAERLAEQTERIRQEAAEQLEALRQQMEAEKKAEIKAAVDAVLRRVYGPKNERFDRTPVVRRTNRRAAAR